ncbi:hypothetical protein Mal4_05440 [Maioricimonas rarisocia]|uniref:Uncharacterized protein n=1 Tax=Maioricimonas rarisocia TaxID=2528026 RepID=A0A517Z194_9PLAN|nr:hypothetical protein [Maioricimonas rarisocia]QDU36260.1 hypothetical protein Mal4_05440 [Maioricimonas rarisocia]
MFRCELCDSVVSAGTRATRVVISTRQKTYESRGQSPSGRGGRGGGGRRGGRTRKKEFDKGGSGTEIVREAAVCPKCAERYRRQREEAQAAAVTAVSSSDE